MILCWLSNSHPRSPVTVFQRMLKWGGQRILTLHTLFYLLFRLAEQGTKFRQFNCLVCLGDKVCDSLPHLLWGRQGKRSMKHNQLPATYTCIHQTHCLLTLHYQSSWWCKARLVVGVLAYQAGDNGFEMRRPWRWLGKAIDSTKLSLP